MKTKTYPLRAKLALRVVYPSDAQRPRTRGECESGPRPCPWISCRYHLALEVRPTGALRVDKRFLTLDGTETTDRMPETCCLDVAARGGITLEAIGGILGIVRERARQIEESALAKMREGWPVEDPE